MSNLQSPRRVLEDAIETLIAVLDMLDPDPDLEETGDEHDQGAPEGWRATSQPLEDAEEDDPAEDDDPGEDNGDAEPSLGQTGRYYNGRLEYDLEHDTSDDEPSLGRLETMHQGAASYAQGWLTDGEMDVLDEPHDGEEGI